MTIKETVGGAMRSSTLFQMFSSVDLKDELYYQATPRETLQFVFFGTGLMSILRGLDYYTTESTTVTIELTQQVALLPYWALAFSFFGAMLCIGILVKRTVYVALAHFALCILYTMISIITTQTTVSAQDGFRSVGPLVLVAYAHYRGLKSAGFPQKSQSPKGTV